MSEIIIVADSKVLPPDSKIWGGIVPAQEREALDWLMLCRFLGWDAALLRIDPSGRLQAPQEPCRCLIFACDPDVLHKSTVREIDDLLLQHPVLVVCRAPSPSSPVMRLCGVFRDKSQIGGQSLTWTGPGRKRFWYARKSLMATALKENDSIDYWLKLQEMPLIVARRHKQGAVATLGFHPSEIRDREGVGTSILKHLLIYGSKQPVAWKKLERLAVLRMDDAGGSQNIFLQEWCYPKMNEDQWAQTAAIVRENNARMSVGYIAGWADDGDASRGSLWLKGEPVEKRTAGGIYPSHHVRYQDLRGHAPGRTYDYEEEWRGLQKLRDANAGDLEPHGYTHIHPLTDRWTAAEDRYTNRKWYHDLRIDSDRQNGSDPVTQATQHFTTKLGIQPTTLIPPQGIYNDQAIETALQYGYSFVNPYYLAVLENSRAIWTTHIISVPLEYSSAKWLDSELPVILFFHDRDIVLNGVEWLSHHLEAWKSAGVERFVDFRQLAKLLQPMEEAEETNRGEYIP